MRSTSFRTAAGVHVSSSRRQCGTPDIKMNISRSLATHTSRDATLWARNRRLGSKRGTNCIRTETIENHTNSSEAAPLGLTSGCPGLQTPCSSVVRSSASGRGNTPAAATSTCDLERHRQLTRQKTLLCDKAMQRIPKEAPT